MHVSDVVVYDVPLLTKHFFLECLIVRQMRGWDAKRADQMTGGRPEQTALLASALDLAPARAPALSPARRLARGLAIALALAAISGASFFSGAVFVRSSSHSSSSHSSSGPPGPPVSADGVAALGHDAAAVAPMAHDASAASAAASSAAGASSDDNAFGNPFATTDDGAAAATAQAEADAETERAFEAEV